MSTDNQEISRLVVQMEELDKLRAQNIVGKIQLERERAKALQLQIDNTALNERIFTQELKIWEENYKRKLSSDQYTLKKLSIDTDKGQAFLDVVMTPTSPTEASEPISTSEIPQMNGKIEEQPTQQEAQ